MKKNRLNIPMNIAPYSVKHFSKFKIGEILGRYFDYDNQAVVGKVIFSERVKNGLEVDSGYLFSRKINIIETKQ